MSMAMNEEEDYWPERKEYKGRELKQTSPEELAKFEILRERIRGKNRGKFPLELDLDKIIDKNQGERH